MPIVSESLQQKLSECIRTGTGAHKAIANYMFEQLSMLPFETAASVAKKLNLSEPTIGRFCRTIGYKSFKDLKAQIKNDLGDSPWLVSDRLEEFRRQAQNSDDQLARGLELEISALVSIYEMSHTAEWATVVKRLASSKTIFVAGFQTERGMAQIFVNQLQYLRGNVILLDLAGGNFSELLLADNKDCHLVIFEARRYSRLARLLLAESHAAQIPTTLVTDSYCDWGRETANEVLVVPTEFNQFWESAAQMASLINLLVNHVFLELGPGVEQRMNEMSRLYSRFTGYVGDTNGPVTDQS